VDGVRTLGPYESLERVIAEHDVRELLVALDSRDHATLMDVIAKASYSRVGIKIMPDMYDIVSGQARVTQLRGVPLIDVSPRLLPAWEDRAKRLLDLVVSSLVLVIGLPIWLLISIIIKVGSRGPIMYSQDRVGRDRIPFRIFKFRTMVFDAEKEGPAWAQRNDPRVTNFGRFLRRTHLDEFPQFWNVLIGEMSIVGPRPERPFFVEQIEREIPYYHRRFCVRPGITGWYQMKVDRYDANLADVEERLRYDFYYIENMSLRMDLRILFGTAYTMIRGRGQA
jgi:exopolysaccharide biosynthesis polyprenyl glycosylphosphotransferase